jgi:ABC-2 type transport system permease protein
MNRVLFAHLWRSQRTKLAIVSIAMAAWSALLPVIYQSFGTQMQSLIDSGVIPKQLTTFVGGDVFTLDGAVALGYVHPITLILVAVLAIGFPTAARAGERQRGTLEVLLARPVSRRQVYATLLGATLVFTGVVLAAASVGTVLGSVIVGVAGQLRIERLPLLWLNGVLLWGAIGAVALAASASFDRLTPALGVTMAVVVASYFLDILGSLWPDAAWLQAYSLFHYLDARALLAGTADAASFAILGIVAAAAIVWALVEFPRRDLAAPS